MQLVFYKPTIADNCHCNFSMKRDNMIAQVEQTKEWDIVIIGGGATGLGCAVDAASRGYKTLLMEQYDFGKGTSGKSTKLVHGGVRYLAQGNIKLVMEALRERAYLLRNAPNVTAVASFVVPVFSLWDKMFYGIGLKMYDMLAGKLSVGKTKWLNKRQTLEYLPGINTTKLFGGILYFDGQFDDTRLAIELAATAVSQGATVLNYCKAAALLKTNNKITGVTFRDTLSDQSYTVQAKVVVNATGVFADAVMQMDKPSKERLIAPSQGVHIVVEKHFFPGNAAMMIPKTDDGRVLFAVPWHNKTILGTTDTPVKDISIEPKPLPEEIHFIIHHANKYLSQTVTEKDVLSTFAGLRPLIKQKDVSSTAVLSRDHTILISDSKLITVSGGKWTTYRRIAEDVILKVITTAGLPQKECVTQHLRIGMNDNNNNRNKEGFLQTDARYSEEDIRYFVEEEMAMTVEDVLARRTRLLFLNAGAARAAAPLVAKQMATLLGKYEQWIEAQVTEFGKLARQYSLPLE